MMPPLRTDRLDCSARRRMATPVCQNGVAEWVMARQIGTNRKYYLCATGRPAIVCVCVCTRQCHRLISQIFRNAGMGWLNFIPLASATCLTPHIRRHLLDRVLSIRILAIHFISMYKWIYVFAMDRWQATVALTGGWRCGWATVGVRRFLGEETGHQHCICIGIIHGMADDRGETRRVQRMDFRPLAVEHFCEK